MEKQINGTVDTLKEKSILWNGDCLKLLENIPDNSIDMLLIDPPYNISRDNNFKSMGSRGGIGMDFGEWDKDFDLTSYIDLFPRILKENSNVVIFNDWKTLGEIRNACLKNSIQMKRCLVLNKSNPVPFNRDRMFVNDVEFAMWGVYNSKLKPTKWTFNRENKFEKCCIDATVQHSKLHPTMKDIKVIEYLVRLLSNKGDTILDCFMGSGTTGVACKHLDRNFIGIELDENYFKIAKERIEGEN